MGSTKLFEMTLYHILLLASFIWLKLAGVKGASVPVSLTVEGGVSLVGPHCPGTVRLVCEGVDLTFLSWRYNGANIIERQFNTDDSPGTIPLSDHPAFVSITLNAVTQAADPLFATFTSTLTVDLGQLQNVTDITCGDIGTDSIPVNVTLLQPTIPATPSICSIIVNYQPTGLSSIAVTWEKLETVCLTLHYDVSVGSGVSQNISQASCGKNFCTAQFNTSVAVTAVLLRAVNNIGPSGTATYPIEQDSTQYFIPEVSIDNCEAIARCEPGSSLSGTSTTCSVQYTTDPTYKNLSNPVMPLLNEAFRVSQRLQANTVYFFVFSVMVDGILSVVIPLEESSGTCGLQMTGPVDIAAAVVVPIVIIVVVVVIIIGIIVYRKRQKLPINCKKVESKGCKNPRVLDSTDFPYLHWGLDEITAEVSGKGVLIAVLDTGINAEHIAFQLPGKIKLFKNFVSNDSEAWKDTDDQTFHGTAIAGVAAGRHMTIEERSIHLGVAQETSLVICCVATSINEFYPDAIQRALKWIYDHNKAAEEKDMIHIVNMSFRLSKVIHHEDADAYDKIKKYLGWLKDQGVICIAAVGNDGKERSPGYPALYSLKEEGALVITVGSCNSSGHVSKFTTDDKECTDLLALGENVLLPTNSTKKFEVVPCSNSSTFKVESRNSSEISAVSASGVATAAVSGLIAVLLQHLKGWGIDKTLDMATKQVTKQDLVLRLLNEHMVTEKCLCADSIKNFFAMPHEKLEGIIKQYVAKDPVN